MDSGKTVKLLTKPLKTHLQNGVIYLPRGKFLQKQRDFRDMPHFLKRNFSEKMAQEKTPDSDYKQPLPDLEPVYCDECLTWIQRYYKDIPYLQMHLNQMLMQNRDLERENQI
jgi:hypothetical protein